MYTITLNGNSADLSCDLFPNIEVGKNARVCLLALQTNNSIPNIDGRNNQLGVLLENNIRKVYTIPVGSFELTEIEDVIKHMLADTGVTFELKANNNTLKCEMLCSGDIDFHSPNNLGVLLGFKNELYKAGVKHQSYF